MPYTASDFPVLRYVEALPIEENTQTYIYVRDPLEIAPSPLVMSAVEFFVVSHFDGTHTLREVKEAFTRKFQGLVLPDEHLHRLLQVLDDNYYFLNENFHRRLTMLKREFEASPVRKAWHAGASYPAHPGELQEKLAAYFHNPVGVIGEAPAAGSPELETPAAILVPHIDLRVGGGCYTAAYQYIPRNGDIDTVVILGVAHYGGEHFFTATGKDFETPLGRIETDAAFLAAWEARAGEKLTRDEWVHRSEHSIEFQLPFLQYHLERPFKIVPVLCGSIEPLLNGGSDKIHAQIEALRETLAGSGRKSMLILSVDLAHMGPKFGDREVITPGKMQEIRKLDFQMFETAGRMDRQAFLECVKTDLLDRRVDACSPVYTLLSILDRGKGKTVSYDQNFQDDSGSLVSYGSMVFWT